jgi:hypothetical protein
MLLVPVIIAEISHKICKPLHKPEKTKFYIYKSINYKTYSGLACIFTLRLYKNILPHEHRTPYTTNRQSRQSAPVYPMRCRARWL